MNSTKSEYILNAAVLGNPVTHSLSPKIHNNWIQNHLRNGGYVPLQCDVNPAALLQMLQHLQAVGFTGVNLTVPFKEMVLQGEIVNHFGFAAAQEVTATGAANTVKFSTRGHTLHNTDVYGVQQTLKALTPDLDELGNALLIGAGGAARAALAAIRTSATSIRILNRSNGRVRQLQEDLAIDLEFCQWDDTTDYTAVFNDIDCVLQCSSAELMAPEALQPLLATKLPLNNTIFFDMVYLRNRPPSFATGCSTRLANWAEQCGATSTDGLPMLVYQAQQAFEIWTGIRPDAQLILQQLDL